MFSAGERRLQVESDRNYRQESSVCRQKVTHISKKEERYGKTQICPD